MNVYSLQINSEFRKWDDAQSMLNSFQTDPTIKEFMLTFDDGERRFKQVVNTLQKEIDNQQI